jgi:ferredoxin
MGEQRAGMKVIAYPDKCVASGQCVMLAPDVFDQDDDGIVVLLTDAPADADREAVEASVRVCPSAAIAVEEE